MAKASPNSDAELRSKARHRANHKVIAESRQHGEKTIHIVNVSAHGFMIDGNPGYQRGERVELRLPVIGRIEALSRGQWNNVWGCSLNACCACPTFWRCWI